MALPPEYVAKAIAGMEALAKNGFRYPFPQYGIQQDVRAGMAVSYPDRARRSPHERSSARTGGAQSHGAGWVPYLLSAVPAALIMRRGW